MLGEQLPLGIQLRDDARFDDFECGDNAELVARLQALATEDAGLLYLHGAFGKTHLLQAVCKAAMQAGRSAAYLPLADLQALGPEVLEGMAGRDVLCVDDLQEVASDKAWALALMRLCDVARAENSTVVFAAHTGLAELAVAVPDLATRLGWGAVYALKPLSDDGKLAVLRLRAQARGLDMPSEVGRYLLSRSSRDLSSLMSTLSDLDVASLAAKRRLTIPFVKDVMGL